MKQALFLAAVTACMAWFSLPAAAQDDDDRVLRGESVVVELDDDGRVVIDGKAIGEAGEPVVVRIDPEDGAIEVEPLEGDRYAHVRVGPRHRFAFKSDDASGPMADFLLDFEPKIQSFVDGFEFDFGDRWRMEAENRRELAELERESRRLAREARRAEGNERQELESQLRSHLEEVFDKKMEIRQERMQRLEEELAELREHYEERANNRERMIDDRLRDLLGESDPLEW